MNSVEAKTYPLLVLLVLVALVSTACEDTEGEVSVHSLIAGDSQYSLQTDPAICDPLGESNPTTGDQGLWGRMYYLEDGQPQYEAVDDYMEFGTELAIDIFFSNLFVPTRNFDQGFIMQGGAVLTNPNGEAMYEYFGLHMETNIKLADTDPEGKYQLAILSDDGAIIDMDFGGGFEEHLNNDGVHPSRFACATEFIELDGNTRLPANIRYYQGPRWHISLILLWREVTPAMEQSPDPYDYVACGVQGNHTFFDPDSPTQEPTAYWDQILLDGWRVLEPDNFELRQDAPDNPCDPGTGCTGIGCGGIGV